jgi:hypothetical protein
MPAGSFYNLRLSHLYVQGLPASKSKLIFDVLEYNSSHLGACCYSLKQPAFVQMLEKVM